jgi:four helix bundle protein
MPIRTYHDLDVFRGSYSAALDVSGMVKRFPGFEQYELASQLRRAARSIPANIVEGWGKRASTPEFKRYLQIAIGSCDETRMWLDMSQGRRLYLRERLPRAQRKIQPNWCDADKFVEAMAGRSEVVSLPPASCLLASLPQS